MSVAQYSGAVKLADINDFLSPSQACIKPLMQDKQDKKDQPQQRSQQQLDNSETPNSNNAQASAGDVKPTRRGRRVALKIEADPSTIPAAAAPKFNQIRLDSVKKTATITLNDCLACSGCVTSAETVLIGSQSAAELRRVLELSQAHRRRRMNLTGHSCGCGKNGKSGKSEKSGNSSNGEDDGSVGGSLSGCANSAQNDENVVVVVGARNAVGSSSANGVYGGSAKCGANCACNNNDNNNKEKKTQNNPLKPWQRGSAVNLAACHGRDAHDRGQQPTRETNDNNTSDNDNENQNDSSQGTAQNRLNKRPRLGFAVDLADDSDDSVAASASASGGVASASGVPAGADSVSAGESQDARPQSQQGGDPNEESQDPAPELFVISLSPQSRLALAEHFGLGPEELQLRLRRVLRRYGVDWLLDTGDALDLALLEAQREFVARWRQNKGVEVANTAINGDGEAGDEAADVEMEIGMKPRRQVRGKVSRGGIPGGAGNAVSLGTMDDDWGVPNSASVQQQQPQQHTTSSVSSGSSPQSQLSQSSQPTQSQSQSSSSSSSSSKSSPTTPGGGLGHPIIDSGPLPVLVAECPGWVCYAEKTQGDFVLPYLSSVKSPQQILGSVVKQLLPARLGLHPSRVYHACVMPCFDKKLEASREDHRFRGDDPIVLNDTDISSISHNNSNNNSNSNEMGINGGDNNVSVVSGDSDAVSGENIAVNDAARGDSISNNNNNANNNDDTATVGSDSGVGGGDLADVDCVVSTAELLSLLQDWAEEEDVRRHGPPVEDPAVTEGLLGELEKEKAREEARQLRRDRLAMELVCGVKRGRGKQLNEKDIVNGDEGDGDAFKVDNEHDDSDAMQLCNDDDDDEVVEEEDGEDSLLDNWFNVLEGAVPVGGDSGDAAGDDEAKQIAAAARLRQARLFRPRDVGASGGYTESVFRYAARELFGVQLDPDQPLEYRPKRRNPDFRELELVVEGRVVLRFALAYGFRNIQNLVRQIKTGTCPYDYVEVMACPSGCMNGGGQLRASGLAGQKQLLQKLDQMYQALPARDPADSPLVEPFHRLFVRGRPEMRARLLHTQYRNVPPMDLDNPLGIKW